MMKTPLLAALLAAVSAALAAPAFASDGAAVTRAQLRAELAALQQAGYQPNRPNDPNYPDNLQAALKRVHDSGIAVAATQTSGYGREADAATQSGSRRAVRTVERSIYFGH
ncbi:DUF4148 domain-containing protein [Burkholderia multivorans]|uniref:DUF4148 domain-containing protein n=1 Tax=Burkholderia multivorans TaxID=87883 RepID=UPI001C2813AE|nr:DUF4148 domain-containing protein [Burkholderia multivorans]MBU9334692.1 DUF4148 domain-containing protein [Burkholderia multivorans]